MSILSRTAAAGLALLMALTLSACKTAPGNNYVVGKRHFVDEQDHDHWVVDCRVGKKTVNGKDELIIRHDEVTYKTYTTVHDGDAC